MDDRFSYSLSHWQTNSQNYLVIKCLDERPRLIPVCASVDDPEWTKCFTDVKEKILFMKEVNFYCKDVRRGFQPTGLHPSRSLHWVGVSCSLRPALPGGGSGLLQGGGRCQEEAGRENAAQHLHLSGVIWPDLNQRLSVCPVIERLLLRGFPDFRRHAQLQEERLSTGQTCLEGAEEETGRSSLRTWRGGLWGPGRRGLYAIKPLLSFMLTHMDVRQSVGFHSFHLKPL